ncbi:hypothetical protein Tery_3838 [Trichodesmium erythraeum IMS101]|uniref:Uncharacterized protein n=2 Tax=Trichodesmium erythraeum TaxID=1206 RepID=Q10XZ4_TRIEI|nr:hypothetical protein [Trichodesmium erythraeum GBRTRLIN201]
MLIRKISIYFIFFIKLSIYIFCTSFIFSIIVSAKIISIKLADNFLYNLILFGDFLRGIEIVEIFNIIAFAVVGMGFGLATVLLPKYLGRYVSTILLVILVPIIFITTQIVRYDIWVEQVAENEKLSFNQAELLIDSFLNKRVGKDGIYGFYLYTAKFPVLPDKKVQINNLDRLEKSVNSKFVRLIGVPPGVIYWTMSLCFWVIRIFYFVIAVVTTIFHFREGLRIVKC